MILKRENKQALQPVLTTGGSRAARAPDNAIAREIRGKA